MTTLSRLIVAWVLLFPFAGWAKGDCEFDLGTPFTTSVEWEFGALPMKMDRDAQMDAFISRMGYGGGAMPLLYDTKFKELFAFYGQDSSGNWVKNLIPASVSKFNLSSYVRLLLQERDGQLYLPELVNLSKENFVRVLNGVMQARGQFKETLKLRKIPEKWRRYGLDLLIPEEVSEEWKFGKFVTLEFPLAGKVHDESEFRAYLVHLWSRLGILPESPEARQYALENAAGHVHWVPNVKRVPEAQTRDYYRAIKGYWGSQNDRMSIGYAAAQFEPGTFDRNLNLSMAVGAYRWLLSALLNYSLVPLGRDVYDQVSVSQKGLFAADKSKIDSWVDANFSPEVKRTFMGLRSIYDLNNGVSAGIVVHPGLESRLWRTTHDNWNSLPTKALQSTNDLELFLANATDGPRGLITDPEGQLQMIHRSGLELDFYNEIVKSTTRNDELDEKVPPPKRAAYLLIPLMDWLNHPAVQFNLSRKSNGQRADATQQLERARMAFVTAMKNYMRARREEDFVYAPDWAMNEAEKIFFSTNRFFLNGRDQAPDNQGLEFEHNINLFPGRLFRIAYAGEFMRFIDRSGLWDLLRPPGSSQTAVPRPEQ